MNLFLAALLGYSIGSIPFSFLVARWFGVKDVRTVGSGNVGATNVMRSAGKVTGAGLFIPLAPSALGVAVLVFVLVLGAARQVSLASILASLTLPIATHFLDASTAVSVTALIAALMVVAKHRANISRLMKGVEPKLGAKR